MEISLLPRDGYFERLHFSHHETLNLRNGGSMRYVVVPRIYGPCAFFVLTRLRMEIIECCPEDLPRLRRCIVRLIVGHKPYWQGPISRLLLEDWLRKELRNIKKGKNRRIDKYLNRVLVPSLGAIDPLQINPDDQILIELNPDHSWSLSGNLSIRFFLEGTGYRRIQ